MTIYVVIFRYVETSFLSTPAFPLLAQGTATIVSVSKLVVGHFVTQFIKFRYYIINRKIEVAANPVCFAGTDDRQSV